MPQQQDHPERLWLRLDLPLEQRVEALLAEMTLAEKVGQTHQLANPIGVTERIPNARPRQSTCYYSSPMRLSPTGTRPPNTTAT